MLYCPHKQVLQCVADLELDIGLYFPRSVLLYTQNCLPFCMRQELWQSVIREYFLTCMTLILHTEKAMAPHSSTPAWKIPWLGEPGGLQSMGSQSRTRLK